MLPFFRDPMNIHYEAYVANLSRIICFQNLNRIQIWRGKNYILVSYLFFCVCNCCSNISWLKNIAWISLFFWEPPPPSPPHPLKLSSAAAMANALPSSQKNCRLSLTPDAFGFIDLSLSLCSIKQNASLLEQPIRPRPRWIYKQKESLNFVNFHIHSRSSPHVQEPIILQVAKRVMCERNVQRLAEDLVVMVFVISMMIMLTVEMVVHQDSASKSFAVVVTIVWGWWWWQKSALNLSPGSIVSTIPLTLGLSPFPALPPLP